MREQLTVEREDGSSRQRVDSHVLRVNVYVSGRLCPTDQDRRVLVVHVLRHLRQDALR